MTDLSPTERATVERFEQAPDALTEVALTPSERACFHAVDVMVPGSRLLEIAERAVARAAAEAADAREAEVRAGVAQAIEAAATGWHPEVRRGFEKAAVIARSAEIIQRGGMVALTPSEALDATAALAPVVARMVAEAADAREAEVRGRIAEAIEADRATMPRKDDPERDAEVGHRIRGAIIANIRAARIARTATLAPADNDGEADR